MSHRIEQVESALRRSIAQILSRGLGDPRIRGLVSVTHVDVAPDMSQAEIHVSVIPEEHGKLSIEGLNSASSRIHTAVYKSMALRRVPRLSFILDNSLKRQAEVDAAIRQGLDKEQQFSSESDDDASDEMPGDSEATQQEPGR